MARLQSIEDGLELLQLAVHNLTYKRLRSYNSGFTQYLFFLLMHHNKNSFHTCLFVLSVTYLIYLLTVFTRVPKAARPGGYDEYSILLTTRF